VSDSGPLGDEPFGDWSFLEGLARMGASTDPWEAARQLARGMATGGVAEPNVDPLVRMRLEELGRVAELQISSAVGRPLTTSGQPVRVVAVTREQWADATLDAYRPLLEALAGSLRASQPELDPGDPAAAMLGPMLALLGPMLVTVAAGSMVGHLAHRSMGQYELPVPRRGDDVLVVPSLVDQFADDWSLPRDDVELWICLHELANHAVLGVPHVRLRVEGLLHRYVSAFEPDASVLEDRLDQLGVELDVDPTTGLPGPELRGVLGDPAVVLGVIQSDEQAALLPELDALVAAIAGWVDHVMDTVGSSLLPSYPQVTEALRRRRVEASAADRFVERLLGLQLTQDRFDRGTAFVRGVVERAGGEGLERLWHSARELPTPNEIDAPGLWLARIDLPD
jgi:putative hydrolase